MRLLYARFNSIPPAPAAIAARVAANGKFSTYLQGSVTQIAVAESVCEGGDADGVEMTRALIADPNLIKKVQVGEDPINCVLCNQACLVEDVSNPIVSCQLNPDAGYELKIASTPATSVSRRTSSEYATALSPR